MPDVLLRRAAESAPPTEAGLFNRDELKREGWWYDPTRKVWIPPDRDHPFEAVRASEAHVGDGASAHRHPAGSIASERGYSLDHQRRMLAHATDEQVAEARMALDRWEDWRADTEAWTHRWDRRVLHLGRVLRAG